MEPADLKAAMERDSSGVLANAGRDAAVMAVGNME
jgi:hypothetical protein